MFGFDFDNIVDTRTTVMTLVFITCCHTPMALLVFENLFCLPGKKVICVLFCLKILYLHLLSDLQIPPQLVQPYYSFFTSYDVSDGLWDVQDVGCLGCRTFRTWDAGDVRRRNVGCLGCGMLFIYLFIYLIHYLKLDYN